MQSMKHLRGMKMVDVWNRKARAFILEKVELHVKPHAQKLLHNVHCDTHGNRVVLFHLTCPITNRLEKLFVRHSIYGTLQLTMYILY